MRFDGSAARSSRLTGDFCVILRFVRHMAGGVRFVFDLPAADSAPVAFGCGPDEGAVAFQFGETARPAPGQLPHAFIRPRPLPVEQRSSVKADVEFAARGEFPVDFLVPVPFAGGSSRIEAVVPVPVPNPCRADHIAPAQVFVGEAQRQRIGPEAEKIDIGVVQPEESGTGFLAARFGAEEVETAFSVRIKRSL